MKALPSLKLPLMSIKFLFALSPSLPYQCNYLLELKASGVFLDTLGHLILSYTRTTCFGLNFVLESKEGKKMSAVAATQDREKHQNIMNFVG